MISSSRGERFERKLNSQKSTKSVHIPKFHFKMSYRGQLPPQSGVILFPASMSSGTKLKVFLQLHLEKENRLAFKYILAHSLGSCRSYITSPSTVILKRPPFREMAQVLSFPLLTSFKAGGVGHVAHPLMMTSRRLISS